MAPAPSWRRLLPRLLRWLPERTWPPTLWAATATRSMVMEQSWFSRCQKRTDQMICCILCGISRLNRAMVNMLNRVRVRVECGDEHNDGRRRLCCWHQNESIFVGSSIGCLYLHRPWIERTPADKQTHENESLTVDLMQPLAPARLRRILY